MPTLPAGADPDDPRTFPTVVTQISFRSHRPTIATGDDLFTDSDEAVYRAALYALSCEQRVDYQVIDDPRPAGSAWCSGQTHLFTARGSAILPALAWLESHAAGQGINLPSLELDYRYHYGCGDADSDWTTAARLLAGLRAGEYLPGPDPDPDPDALLDELVRYATT